MRRIRPIAALVLVCVAAVICLKQSAVAATTAGATTNGVAPADAYFGRMKMSYLGINNSLRDAYVMAGEHTVYPAVIQKIKWAEEAFRDWQRKYPHDPQLPRSTFFLFGAYLKVWNGDGQSHALQYVKELRDKYGSTYFGKLIRANLAKGLTLHVFYAALPCSPAPGEATPAPPPAPSPDPAHHINVQYEVAPCVTPPPSPLATPPPAASASPALPMRTVAPTAAPSPAAMPSAAATSLPSAAPASTAPATPSSTPTSAPKN
jgi:hypothetical protein